MGMKKRLRNGWSILESKGELDSRKGILVKFLYIIPVNNTLQSESLGTN